MFIFPFIFSQLFLNSETGQEQPHVTLYLTKFRPEALQTELPQRISKAVDSLITVCRPILGMEAVSVQGTYGMWAVEDSGCLQFWSDTIVNATYDLAVKNQSIPSWVEALPEPARSEKIALIQKYGSPNVFAQFWPHVTLAYDTQDSATAFTAAFAALPLPAQLPSYEPPVLGLGTVGIGGSVVRGKDLADFPIQQ